MCALGSSMAIILLIGPHVPRADVLLLFLLALSPVFYFFAVNKSWAGVIEIRKDRWLWAAFLGLSLYLHLNAFWAPNLPVAIQKAATFTLVFLIVLLMAGTYRLLSDGVITAIGKVIIWASAIGTGLACLEFATGHAIREALYLAWPFIRPGDNSIKIIAQINGEMVQLLEDQFRRHYDTLVIQLQSAATNRNATFIMLLLWPVLLLAANQTNIFKRRAAVLLIGGASALSIALSASQTAQAALFLSTLAFFGAMFVPRLMHRVIVGAWCIATVLAVPLAATPYELGLNREEWVFRNAQDRIKIWHYTARQIPKAPLLGAGIRSTRVISKELQDKAVTEPGDTTPLMRLGLHAHNHYLQIWFELGAVGAALFLLAGLVLLRKIRFMTPSIRPYATASFVAACGIAAFGWGLWQTWLLAGYSLSAIFLIFAMEFAKRPAKSATRS